MTWQYWKVINKAEFEATGLVSRELDLIMEGVGQKTVLVTKGNVFAITVDDVFLPLGVTNDNPFIIGDRAIALDENGDIYYGIGTA